jgi:hypothetical protein
MENKKSEYTIMNTQTQNKKGFALFTVLFIIAAISVMLGTLVFIGSQRAFTAKRLVNKVKALAYAEAGIDYAYSILSMDFEDRTNSSLFALSSTNASGKSIYGDGSFDITLTPVSNKYVIVTSVGECGNAMVTAEILVDDENAGSGGNTPADYSNMEGFNYAILSGGTFDFGGSGTVGTIGAKLHSNSPLNNKGSAKTEVDISSHTTISIGNNKTITGDVTTPDPDWTTSKITITGTATTKAVPAVTIPDIDLTPYFLWAKKNKQVYSSGDTLPQNPAGGVIWVDGDLTLSSGGSINGSIIATGDIHISGGSSMDVSSTTTAFALASRDGDVTITTSGTLKGLVYVKNGDYSQTANGRLEGQLIVNGNIKKGGNSDIVFFKRSVPSDPDPASTDPVSAWPVVAAWQK